MTAVFPAPLVRNQGETLSTSTSIAVLGCQPGAQQARILNPAQDFRLHWNPALMDAVFFDASASAGARYKHAAKNGSLKQDLTDRSTGGASGTLLDAMTTSDILYLCFYDIIGGIRVGMISGSVNANASVIDAEYFKNDDTWADLAETDGTDSVGATLAQTGNITWTAPTDWKTASLRDILTTEATPKTEQDAPNTHGYWLRIKVSAALSADVEIDEVWAINKDTNRGYYPAAMIHEFSLDRRAIGALEIVTVASTDTTEITWVRS